MTDDAPIDPRDADDLLAAEYVLGTLDRSERLAAEARIKADPGFARAVEDWENRLSGLNDGYAPVPAPDLLPQIEARLFPAPPKRRFGRLAGWLAGALTAGALAVLRDDAGEGGRQTQQSGAVFHADLLVTVVIKVFRQPGRQGVKP